MSEGKLYRVLKSGVILQRSGDGWRAPKEGDHINMSDEAAVAPLERGYVEIETSDRMAMGRDASHVGEASTDHPKHAKPKPQKVAEAKPDHDEEAL